MGKSFRRYDKDDQYSDIKNAKEYECNFRNRRHQRDVIEPAVEVSPIYKADHSKNRLHSNSDFFKVK